MSVTDEHQVPVVGEDDAELESGLEVGEYVIREKIGEGGFGTVYRGEHPLIGKEVAVKVLARQYSADPEMVSRFVAEARAVNQIRHRNIIDIFAFGQLEDGRHYYIMEYLAGMPLDEYLEEHGPLPIVAAVPILRGIARALDAAHAHGIAHRDLKPENVFLLLEDGQPPFPKILDFGIAKLLSKEEQRKHKTRTGAPIGTPLYMSPEQCRGRDVDHRTDIYAFGVLVYQMLAGRVPFDADNYMDILLKQMNEEPEPASSVNPEVPAGIDASIGWMMEKLPDSRPPTLCDGLADLEAVARSVGLSLPGGGPTSAIMRAPTTLPPLGAGAGPVVAAPSAQLETTSRSRGWWIAAGLLLVGALAVGAAVMLSRGGGESKATAASSVEPDHESPPDTAPTEKPEVDPDPTATPPPTPADRYVRIELTGAPAGTEVFGPGGKLYGVAPGAIQLERNTGEVQLVLRADGYKPTTLSVSTAAHSSHEVALEKKAEARPHPYPRPRPRPRPRPKSRHSIEDPF